MNDYSLKFGRRIYEWLSQFGTVYRNTQPSGVSGADLYLLINGYVDGFGQSFIFPVQIYNNKTTSFNSILQVAQSIEETVGESGILVIYDDIRFTVHKGSPFYQDRPIENETIRAGYVNLEITIY